MIVSSKRTFFLSFFFLAFCITDITAQESDTLTADNLYSLAKASFTKGNFLEGADYNERAAEMIRLQAPLDESFLRKVLGNWGLCLYNAGDNAQAVPVFREAYELGTKLIGESDVRVVRYRFNLSAALVNLKRYEEAIYLMSELDKTLSAEVTKNGALLQEYHSNLSNLAVVYMELGEMVKAEEIFLSEVVFRKNNNDDFGVGMSHYNLGDLHRRSGRTKQAIHHYKLAYENWKDSIRDQRLYIHLLLRLASVLASQQNKTEARIFLDLTREQISSSEFSPNEKGYFLHSLSTIYFSMAESSQAIDAAAAGLKLFEESDQDLSKHALIHDLVKYYTEANDLSSAGKYYQEGEKVLEIDMLGASNSVLYAVLQRSNYLLAIGQFKELITLSETFNEKTNWQELVYDQGKTSMYRPDYLTGLMTNLSMAKAAISKKMPTQQEQIVGLEESLDLFINIDDYLSALQFSEALEEDADWTKIFAGENYGAAVRLCHDLYQITKDEKYLDRAFYYAERTKYWAIFQQWSERAAYGTEPEWKRQERNLRQRIYTLEQNILAATSNNDALLHDLNASKLALNTRLYEIRDSIRRFTKGASENSWLNQDLTSIPEVKQQLKKDEVLLSFFTDGEAYWLFHITPDKTELRPLPAEFAEQARIFSQSIFSPFQNSKEPDSDMLTNTLIQYQNSGKWLMETIFPQGLDYANLSRLIIVPAGETETIPFAALPVREITDLYKLQEYPYLMREAVITYGYSATLWQFADKTETKNAQKSPRLKAIVPFEFGENTGPVFYEPFGKEDRYNFPPLKNKEALAAITDQINAVVVTFPQATKEEVFADEEEYSILYLSTHSIPGEEADGGPFLAFTRPDTFSRSDFLYAREILQQNLSLDLVVLNSCESSLGNYVPGEGAYSLSRSFAYAGSRSVVATLWPINNRSSAELGSYFISALKKGLPKDVALREAQLEMLREKDATLTHPFFWAAFAHYGNRAPVW